MQVNIGMITVSGRESYAETTLNSLRNNIQNPTVLKDYGSCLCQGHILCWEKLFSGSPSYAILFQDDLIAARNTIPAMLKILEEKRPDFITFYTNKSEVMKEAGYNPIKAKSFCNEQAVAMSRDCFEQYDNWVHGLKFMSLPATDWKHHDVLLRAFLEQSRFHPYAFIPCLVQHVGEISAMGNPWKCGKLVRQTRAFAGEDIDALGLPW
jgi:hypothetical protein